MMGSLPAAAARDPRVRAALARVLACRVLTSRGLPTSPAVVAAAAAAPDAAVATDLVRRVTARAVREATSSLNPKRTGGGISPDGGGAWSRALWSDLAALAAPDGALSPHFSREDAAAELLRAQLRVGGGAEHTPTARRILHDLFLNAPNGGDSGDTYAFQSHFDVTMGSAAGAMAGQLKGAGGAAVGAFGGMVKDVKAGKLSGAEGVNLAAAAVGALGGFVAGTLSAAAAELGAAGGTDWLPPVLPASRAEAVIVEVAREHLYSATAADDPAVARAEAILACVPPSSTQGDIGADGGLSLEGGRQHSATQPIDGSGGGKGGEGDNTNFHTITAVRDTIAVVRMLPGFGVVLAPAQLRQTADRFEVIHQCLAAGPAAYLRADDLRALAARLGLGSSAQQHAVSAACARAALAAGDGAAAAAAALRLAAAGYAPAWDVAAAVAAAADAASATQLISGGGGGRTPGPEARQKLLSFALAHCPPGRMPGLLAAWQGLEANRMVAAAVATEAAHLTADPAASSRWPVGSSSLPLSESAAAALRRAAPGLRAAAAARPRGARLRALASGPLPALLYAATGGGSGGDGSPRRSALGAAAAAAAALAYSLGLHGVCASDEVMAPLAVHAALAAANANAIPHDGDDGDGDDNKGGRTGGDGTEAETAAAVEAAGALPLWAGLPLGMMVSLSSASAVSAAVRTLASLSGSGIALDGGSIRSLSLDSGRQLSATQPISGGSCGAGGAFALKIALALGARAHALRAFRATSDMGDNGGGVTVMAALTADPAALAALALAGRSSGGDKHAAGGAAAEVDGLRRCRAQLRAMADAQWLAARLPGLIDPASFVADDGGGGYRREAVLALASTAGPS